MELSALKFSVETKDLEKASGLIGDLVTNLEQLDQASLDVAKAEALRAKAARDAAKADLDNERAQQLKTKGLKDAERAERAATAATQKNISMLQLQGDTYEFILEGFSKGDAKVLAMAKATGQLSDELKKVLTDIRQFSKNTFDQTETGLDRMVKSAKEASTAQNFLNEGLRLTTKQAKELSNDLDRLNIRLQHQGASYQEIVKQQAIYKQNFIEEASAVNRATDALSNIEKQRRDTASASNYLTQADQRMAAALNQSNAALDKGSTDSLVKYETALRKSGISQELATQKLATYKTQLAQVQQLENRRREEFLARAIMPQVTDVAVSLWSGQNPLTVLLQQGGQVTDLFNQSGIAAEKFGESVKTAMKGMLPSILTVVKGVGGLLVDGFVSAGNAARDFSGRISGVTAGVEFFKRAMAAGGEENFKYIATLQRIGTVMSGVFGAGIAIILSGLVALAIGLKQVITENNELAKSFALTGASIGLTHSQVLGLVKTLAESGATTGQATEALVAMAKTGKFTSQELLLVGDSAIQMSKGFGISIEDTVKQFAKLKEKPVEALLEIAKATGQVPPEIIKMVIELEKAGKITDAASIAMKAYADSNTAAFKQMREDYNGFALFMIDLGQKIKQFFSDTFKTLFIASDPTAQLSKQLANTQQLINQYKNAAAYSPDNALGKQVKLLEDQARAISSQISSTTRLSAEEAKRKQLNAENAAIQEASLKLTKEAEGALDKQGNKTKSLADFQKQFIQDKLEGAAKEKSIDIEKLRQNKDLVSLLEKQANLEYQKIHKSDSKQTQKDLETEIDLRNKDLGLLSSFNNELAAIERRRKDTGNEEKYQESLNALIEKQPIYLERQKEINAAHDLSNKLFGQADMLGKEYYKTLEQINREEASGLRSPENAEKARQAAFDQTKLAKDNLKYIEDSTKAYNKYKEESQKSLDSSLLENQQLDNRLSLLGLTEDQQKKLRIEQQRKNSLLAVEQKLTADILKIKQDSSLDPNNSQRLIIDLEQAAAEERKVINREVAVQAAEDYDAEFKKIKSVVSESIAAALFDGGKAGSSKIKDYLKAKLRERITLSIDAFINPIMGAVSGALGFGGSSGSSSALSSASGLFSNGGGLLQKAAGFFGLSPATGAGAAMSAGTTAGSAAGMLSSVGSALPYLGAALAIYSIAKSLDDSGTLHTGGAAQYSAFGGLTSGSSGAAYDFGFGKVEAGQSTISAMETLSKSLVQIFDGIAKTFGKTAGYEVATAFADDTSKDGAWGAFKIQLGGVEILNWDDFRQSKWAPKEFGDGQEGYQQYLSAIAKDTRKVLLDMNLPAWANKILSDLGESASIENLTSAIAQIGNIRTVFENLKSTFTQLSSISDSTLESLMNLSGGIDSLANAASSYYNNFYSDVEKANKLQADLTKSLGEYNLALPATKEAYRALVEAQNVSTEAGARAYVALLQNSSMFAELIAMQAELANAEKDTTEEVSNSVKALSNSVIEEINRLRGYTENSSSPQNLISEFNRLTTLARGGDVNAFNSLGNQAGLLDDYYKNTSVSAAEYAFQRAILANSLEQSYNTVKSSGGVFDGSVSIMGTPSLVSPSVSTIPVSSNDNSSLIKSLINEVALVRIAIEADVIQNAKTAKILERVTPEGDALATRTEG